MKKLRNYLISAMSKQTFWTLQITPVVVMHIFFQFVASINTVDMFEGKD